MELSRVFSGARERIHDEYNKHAQKTVQHQFLRDVVGSLVVLLFQQVHNVI